MTIPAMNLAHAEEAGHEGETGHAEEEGVAGEEHAEGEVEIDAAAYRACGHHPDHGRAWVVSEPKITAQATVVAAPNGEAILTARAAGAITDIRKRLGDPVNRGETVALVLSPEAAALSASVDEREVAPRIWQRRLVRARKDAV